MLIASFTRTDNGRKVLVIGLHDLNMIRLRNDEPIYRSLEEVSEQWKGWDLAVLGPEDLERFVVHGGWDGGNV